MWWMKVPGGTRGPGLAGSATSVLIFEEGSATTWTAYLGCILFFLKAFADYFFFMTTEVLSFTNLSAADLGTRLLQWGPADWNQGNVTTYRVQKSKKKNKGRKRSLWIQEVKAYHARKAEEEEDVGGGSTFPDAPWWQAMQKEAEEAMKKQQEEDDDCKVVEPLVKHQKKDPKDPDGGDTGGKGFFAIFGP